MQGVKSIKKTDLNPYYVFIMPPSIKALEDRLRRRGTETEEKIKLRLINSIDEINYGTLDGSFHERIVNEDLDVAYAELEALLLQWYTHIQS